MRTALLLALALLTACGGGKMTPAPTPFRPKAVGTTAAPPPTDNVPADCSAVKDTLGAMTYAERSISESNDFVTEANTMMSGANGQGVEEYTRQQLFKEAVDKLIAALAADPYNVNATYGLAAAYATIKRTQCSINMLTRLLQMRTHPSKEKSVEAKLDLLLGRKKQTKDPAFGDSVRTDARFRALVKGICANDDCSVQ